MKLTIDRKKFLDEFAFVSSIVNPKSTQVMFSKTCGVLANGTLAFYAMDGVAATKSHIEIDSNETAEFAVNPAPITDLLRTFSTPTFNLSVTTKRITISSGKSRYSFPILDIYGMPDHNYGDQIVHTNYVNLASLAKLGAMFAHDKETTQYTLKSFKLTFTEGSTELISTDGCRFVKASLPEDGDGRNLSIQLEKEYVSILLQMARSEQIKIAKTTAETTFITDDRVLAIRNTPFNYPDVDVVFNRVVDNTHIHTVKSSEMLIPLRRLLTTIGGATKAVKLGFQNNEITLAAHQDSVESEEKIESVGTDDGTIKVNGEHLATVLSNTGEQTELRFNTHDKPLLITGQDGFQYILGPMV